MRYYKVDLIEISLISGIYFASVFKRNNCCKQEIYAIWNKYPRKSCKNIKNRDGEYCE